MRAQLRDSGGKLRTVFRASNANGCEMDAELDAAAKSPSASPLSSLGAPCLSDGL